MARSNASGADAELISALSSVDRQVSRFQLERWRSHGLLPHPTVLHERFGGTKIEPHPDWVFDAALKLSGSSGRGSPWQWGGVLLFEEGLPLSGACLQQCATWLVENVQGRIRAHWNAVAATFDATEIDPEDERFALADKTVDRVLGDRRLRAVVRSVRQGVLVANPNAGTAELRDLLRSSLTYRVIDIVWPGGLTSGESRIAISGSEEPAPNITPLLPSAIASCAATLTLAEASVASTFQSALERTGAAAIRGLLMEKVLLLVVEARVTRGLKSPTVPISFSDLEEILDDARQLNEMADEDVHIDQMDIFDILEDEQTPPLQP
jgi:hypothetical protein